MFIAHLPGAYLAFKAFAPKSLPTTAFIAGMIGSVAPDLDMFWFYLVDNKQHHHHDFLTHRPMLWLALFLVFWAIVKLYKPQRWTLIGMSFSTGGLIHMALDSIAGKISWLWPISDISAPLVVVQATHSHWVASFLSHWTFKVEIVITILALLVLIKSRRA